MQSVTYAVVREKAERSKRLISWLALFVREDEGIGDVAWRMLQQAQGRSIAPILARLLNSCNCKEEDAVSELNRRYPYLH